MISDFMRYLQTDWSLKSLGVTGYMNALGHLLDFPRSYNPANISWSPRRLEDVLKTCVEDVLETNKMFTGDMYLTMAYQQI